MENEKNNENGEICKENLCGSEDACFEAEMEEKERPGEGNSFTAEMDALNGSYKKLAVDVKEMHKLYHNEFAGRLRTMQEELDRYHEIDRGRAFDDILREIARIYCDNENLLSIETDETLGKRIKYLFMDMEQLLESNGVMMQKSKPGDKRNNKFCQVVERIETNHAEKHDTVVCSKATGFYTEKRPLIKELVDVYVYQADDKVDNKVEGERS